jgi:hypothetical protein
MQIAHSLSSWTALPFGWVVAELAPLASLLALKLATWGELGLAHAARPMKAVAARVAKPTDPPSEPHCPISPDLVGWLNLLAVLSSVMPSAHRLVVLPPVIRWE